MTEHTVSPWNFYRGWDVYQNHLVKAIKPPIRASRQWVTWHVIEHDLHHGGELSFSPGAHGLAAPDF